MVVKDKDTIEGCSELLSLGGMMRIARRIAASGVASRRQAEKLVLEGRVTLSGGVKIEDLSRVLSPDEEIALDGKSLGVVPGVQVWRYYKPRKCLTARSDPQGRRVVFDDFPEGLQGVFVVGRLDYGSEGLLLLTNNGRLSRLLEHPEQGLERVYRVRIDGRLPRHAARELREGIEIEGMVYRGIDLEFEGSPQGRGRGESGRNNWVKLVLREGKNREIRRVMKHYDREVSRLLRVSYAGIGMEGLERGEVRALSEGALHHLLQDLVEGLGVGEGQ